MKKPLAILLLLFSFGSAQETIAVIEFEAKGISQIEASALSDELEMHLTNIGGYTLVERGKVEEVLQEQGFQQTGCTSDECAVEVGMLLSVQNIVLGSISKVGSTFSVNAKIVDVQTGEILKQASYKFRGLIDDLLVSGMAEVTSQLIGKSVAQPTLPNTSRVNFYTVVDVDSVVTIANNLFDKSDEQLGSIESKTPYQDKIFKGSFCLSMIYILYWATN
jgi:TolB-like protein